MILGWVSSLTGDGGKALGRKYFLNLQHPSFLKGVNACVLSDDITRILKSLFSHVLTCLTLGQRLL
jgi:hypothetical protein